MTHWTWVVAPIAALAGVLVGGLLSRRQQEQQWLRDTRLALYVDLLDSLRAMHRVFAGELAVAKYHPDDSEEDFAAVGERFVEQMMTMYGFEHRVDLVGDDTRGTFGVLSLWLSVAARLLESDKPEEAWTIWADELDSTIDGFVESGRKDLQVRKWEDRWRHRLRRKNLPTVEGTLSEYGLADLDKAFAGSSTPEEQP